MQARYDCQVYQQGKRESGFMFFHGVRDVFSESAILRCHVCNGCSSEFLLVSLRAQDARDF